MASSPDTPDADAEPDDEPAVYECPECDFVSATERGRNIHYGHEHEASLAGVTVVCEACGDEFDAIPAVADDRRYCSAECHGTGRQKRDQRECPQCGRAWSTVPSDEQKYCCSACWSEAKTDTPRPDHPAILLWVLCVYEGHSVRETYRRQRAVLGDEECLRNDQVVEWSHATGANSQSLRRAALDADPSDVGFDTLEEPDGDETWREYYERNGTGGDA